MVICLARQRAPSEAFVHISPGLIESTPCVLAATSSTLHLFAVDVIGSDEYLTPIDTLNLFGQIVGVQQGSIPGLWLALLSTGQLAAVAYRNSKLQVQCWSTTLECVAETSAHDDPAVILKSLEEAVAVATAAGRVTLLLVDALSDGSGVKLQEVERLELRPDGGVAKCAGTLRPQPDAQLVSLRLSIKHLLGGAYIYAWHCWERRKDPKLPPEQFTQTAKLAAITGNDYVTTDLTPAPFFPDQIGCCLPSPVFQRPPSAIRCLPGPPETSRPFSSHGGALWSPTIVVEHASRDVGNAVLYFPLTLQPPKPVYSSAASAAFTCTAWEQPVDSWSYNHESKSTLLVATSSGHVFRFDLDDVAGTAQQEKAAARGAAAAPEEPVARHPDFPQHRYLEGVTWALDGSKACQLEGIPVALAPLAHGRLVCLLEDHSLAYLTLKGDAYVLRHLVQSAGPIAVGGCSPLPGPQSSILAARARPRFLEAAVPEFAARDAPHPQPAEPSPPLPIDEESEDFPPEEEDSGNSSCWPMVGGRSCYGAQGALVTLHADLVPETLFESELGEAEGVTGLWPLKRSPADAHHAAVLLGSTSGTRVIATDSQSQVFGDITDSLSLEPAAETLAAGNFGDGGWVAQITPHGVHAFDLSGRPSSLNWCPPAGSTVSGGSVASGLALVQCMAGGRHSVTALSLRHDSSSSAAALGSDATLIDAAPELVHLATVELPAEASCISNALLAPDGAAAAVAVGLHGASAPSIFLFELSNLLGDPGVPPTTFMFLGEVALDDFSAGNLQPSSSPSQAAAWMPGSPLAAARNPKRDTTGATLPESIVLRDEAAAAGSCSGDADRKVAEEKRGYRESGVEMWVSTRHGYVYMVHVYPPAGPSPQQAQQAQRHAGQWSVLLGHHPRALPHSALPPTLCPLPPLPRFGPAFAALAFSDRLSLLRSAAGGAAVEELRLDLPGVEQAVPLVLIASSGAPEQFLLAIVAGGALKLASLEAHSRSRTVASPLPWLTERVATHPAAPNLAAVGAKDWVRDQEERPAILPNGSDSWDFFFIPEIGVVDVPSGRLLASTAPGLTLGLWETVTCLALLPAGCGAKKSRQEGTLQMADLLARGDSDGVQPMHAGVSSEGAALGHSGGDGERRFDSEIIRQYSFERAASFSREFSEEGESSEDEALLARYSVQERRSRLVERERAFQAGSCGENSDALCYVVVGTRIPHRDRRAHPIGGRLLLFVCPRQPTAAVDSNAPAVPSSTPAQLALEEDLYLPAAVTALSVTATSRGADLMVGMGRRLVQYELFVRGKEAGGRCFIKSSWTAVNAELAAVKPAGQDRRVLTASAEGAACFKPTPSSLIADAHSIFALHASDEVARAAIDLSCAREFYVSQEPSEPEDSALQRQETVSAAVLDAAGGVALLRRPRQLPLLQPRAHFNLGERGAALVRRKSLHAVDADGPIIAVDCGGGTTEIVPAELEDDLAGVLFGLQRAIVAHPVLGVARPGPGGGYSAFRGTLLQPPSLDGVFHPGVGICTPPAHVPFRHPDPEAAAAEEALEKAAKREEAENPVGATAEGPEPPAVVVVQPQHLVGLETKDAASGEAAGPNEAASEVFLDGAVLRLFLEVERRAQHELLQAADPEGRWMPGVGVDARAAVMAYELGQLLMPSGEGTGN